MRTRILWNDLKGSPLLAVTTWLFMAVSACLFALTCFLTIGLLGSVDTLMEAAQTPDFLQMHAGGWMRQHLPGLRRNRNRYKRFRPWAF